MSDDLRTQILKNVDDISKPVSLFEGTSKGGLNFRFGCGCHYDMRYNWKKEVFGQYVLYTHKLGPEAVQHFLEWLLDPKESVFSVLLQELGDRLVVVRDDDGKIVAYYVQGKWGDINRFVLFNFFKSIRVISEHPEQFSFWHKWAVGHKKNPRLAYILSGAYDVNGGHKYLTHAALEDTSSTCDLRKILQPNKENWNINKEGGPGDYYGEQANTWCALGKDKGYNFNLHKEIPVVSLAKEVPTRFWGKYYGAAAQKHKGVSDASLINFFDNTDEIYTEYLKRKDVA